MSTAALSTAGARQRARRPGRWCGHGHQATLFMGKVPVWSDGSTTLSNMCSGAGSGAAGSAGAGGAVDAGCLDPMLDRLLAVEVAGLPDSALVADLVGLRVAVSRLESEYSRRLVVFDRRGAAGVTGAVSLSLIHISEPTRLLSISYAVFCLKKKNNLHHYLHTWFSIHLKTS